MQPNTEQQQRQTSSLDLGQVVFYDGDCGLCHASVRFALERDDQANFRYAPLFGETYKEVQATGGKQIGTFEVDLDNPPDSLLLFGDNRLLVRTRAVRTLLSGLRKPWPLVAKLLGVVPTPIADLGYRIVAASRKMLFKAPEGVCPLVPMEQRSRFLG